MKKIFTLILVACLSLVAFAQSTLTKQPQALKTIMAKEHLSNTMQSLHKPVRQQAKLVAAQPVDWSAANLSEAKAPAKLTGLDTTEVYFTSFYDDPMYYDAGD